MINPFCATVWRNGPHLCIIGLLKGLLQGIHQFRQLPLLCRVGSSGPGMRQALGSHVQDQSSNGAKQEDPSIAKKKVGRFFNVLTRKLLLLFWNVQPGMSGMNLESTWNVPRSPRIAGTKNGPPTLQGSIHRQSTARQQGA